MNWRRILGVSEPIEVSPAASAAVIEAAQIRTRIEGQQRQFSRHLLNNGFGEKVLGVLTGHNGDQ